MKAKTDEQLLRDYVEHCVCAETEKAEFIYQYNRHHPDSAWHETNEAWEEQIQCLMHVYKDSLGFARYALNQRWKEFIEAVTPKWIEWLIYKAAGFLVCMKRWRRA